MKLWGIILDNGQSVFVSANSAQDAIEEWGVYCDAVKAAMPAVQLVRAIAEMAETPAGHASDIFIGPRPMARPGPFPGMPIGAEPPGTPADDDKPF